MLPVVDCLLPKIHKLHLKAIFLQLRLEFLGCRLIGQTLLFLVITMDETGIVTAMKYQFGECDEKSYPVCRIRLTEEKIPVISMYHVPPVIPFIIAKECVFALKE